MAKRLANLSSEEITSPWTESAEMTLVDANQLHLSY
jgi:hypothetical protein